MRTLSLVFAVAAALSFNAYAAEQKPDFQLKTKAAEIAVRIDAKLKKDAKLAANCLAEGKRWVEQQRKDSDAARKEEPERFATARYTFERSYLQRSDIADRYISIIRSDYSETGGTHPNIDLDTILWDTAQAKRISIRPFFSETEDGGPTMTLLQRSIIAAVKAEKAARKIEEAPDDTWFDAIQPKLTRIGGITLARSTEAGKSAGLTAHFSQYTVGTFVEGDYAVFIPWQTFKAHLSVDGRMLFGGDRPSNDLKD